MQYMYAYIFFLLETVTDHIFNVVHFVDQKVLPTSATCLSPDSMKLCVLFHVLNKEMKGLSLKPYRLTSGPCINMSVLFK